VGFLNNYWAIAVAVMISGLGNSIFHPEGSRLANHVSGENKSTGMSIFSVGGNMGFVVGPVIISMIIPVFGIKGTAVFMIPACVMAVILMAASKWLPDAEKKAEGGRSAAEKPKSVDDRRAFAKLAAMVFFRSAATYGVITFVPIYWVETFKQTEAAGSMALAIYSFSAACATLIGGRLADRYGFNIILRISVTAFVPAIYLFTLTNNIHLALAMLIPIGIAANLCFSTVTVMGQAFLPNHIGFASGVTIGMGVSIGGLAAPAFGRVSDLYGLLATFHVIIAVAFVAAVLGYIVPRPSQAAKI